MFEGKHIHFSPVDNKPLCSYSSKLCRQRRLNGYAFCIRHILEDKSAPFKRCTYVTRNNNQICQNAIPTNQDRGYCHSHMQVAGIIPKTERKVKKVVQEASSGNGNGPSSVKSESSSSIHSSTATSSLDEKKDPNAVFKFEEEEVSEIKWVPKSGSINVNINGIVGGTKVAHKNKAGTQKEDLKPRNHNGIPGSNGTLHNGSKKLNGTIHHALDGTKSSNARQTVKQGQGQGQGQTGLSNGSSSTDVTALEILVNPENQKLFEQLKTLKTVEKSVLSSKDGKSRGANGSRTIPEVPSLSFLKDSKAISKFVLPNQSSSSVSVINLFNNACAQKVSLAETRQEFLTRVREAFKSQYLIIKNTAKENDKNEKIWKRALRTSLLKCVIKDSGFSAHVIVQNDPAKYSDLVSNVNVNCDKKAAPKQRKSGKKSNDVASDEGSNQSGGIASPATGRKGKPKAAKRNPSGMRTSQRKKKARTGEELGSDESNNVEDTLQPKTTSQYKGHVQGQFSATVKSPMLGDASIQSQRGYDSHTHTMVGPSASVSFRLPRTEGQVHFNDVDMKASSLGHGGYNNFNSHNSNHPLLHPHSGSATTAKICVGNSQQAHLQHILNQPDLRTLANTGNHSHKNNRHNGMNTVLNSVGSSDLGTPDGMINSSFEYPSSTQPDCDFSDDDLEKSLEFPLDPETEHQASRLLEDNGLTEDDLNELFPEATNKMSRSSDLSDLGDFSSAFDANDIDYSLFANIFPFNRTSQSESISISNQY